MQCTLKTNYDKYGLWIAGSYPCGKCLSCRTRYRQEWASRILLESRTWHNNLFFTLTYSEEHLPDDGLLSKRHLQNFIQNWKRQQGHAPRYFIAGEYGPLNQRPHYHGIFFGEDLQLTPRAMDGRLQDNRFLDAWVNKGYIDARDFGSSKHGSNVATYVAGYILKNSWSDTLSNSHQNKEWAIMSRRPAIGSGAGEKISSALTGRHGVEVILKLGTAPARFKYGGRSWIMPYRVRKQICQELDIPFKPLDETLELELNTGEVYGTTFEKKSISEALAAERKLRASITRSHQAQLTKGKN